MENNNGTNNDSNSIFANYLNSPLPLHGLSFLADCSFGELDENSISPFRPAGHSFPLNQQFSPPPQPTMAIQTPPPKTPERPPPWKAFRVAQKIHYETRPNTYLVEWCQGGKSRKYQTWENEGSEAQACRELIGEFDQKLANDPQLAKELTSYDVEAILDRTIQGELRYLVKWLGWIEATWEKKDYLLRDYGWLIDAFDAINGTKEKTNKRGRKRKGAPMKVSEGGTEEETRKNFTWVKEVKKAVEATRVLSKLDRGNCGPSSYLLQWPPDADKRINTESMPTPDNNSNWETFKTIGNKRAVEEFEASLKRGEKWAKDQLQFEAEKIVDKKMLGGRKVKYLVKWRGFDMESACWMGRDEILGIFDRLIVQYEVECLRKKKNLKFTAAYFENEQLAEETIRQLRKIGKKLNKQWNRAEKRRRKRQKMKKGGRKMSASTANN